MGNVLNMVGGGGGGGIRLASIAITTAPAKTAYKVGETFDPTGMVVTATYSNGATLIVGGYTVSPQAMALGVTAVTVTYTEGGVSRTAQQAVTVTRTQLPVPTATGTLIYNGSSQSPTLTNDPGALATKTGDTSAINAGDYELALSLVDPDAYEWSTGSTADLTVAWSIGKASANLAVSPTSLTLHSSHPTRTAAVTTDSPGAVTVSSSDTSVATASISGGTLTVSSVNSATGTATITLSQAATANYLAATATVSVTARFVSIYGVSWDGSASSACTRTDAAALFADPVPYVSGMTAAQCSSPFDGLMPWAGMTRQVSAAAGEMVKIPKFWYKLTAVGTKGVKIQIADGAVDGFAVCPACMDRGDGAGERDYVLVGRYHCAASDYRSRTGENPKVSVAQNAFRVACHNLGANVYMMDFATRFTLRLLYIVEFANWNSQETIGYGCSPSGAVFAMGYTDSMPYHTGTTAASRTTYGGTQYRYIEGLWDNVYDRLTGCYNNSSGLNITLNPANFAEDSGGVAVGTPVSGYTSGWTIVTAAGFAMFIPSEASGDGTNYVGDYWAFGASYPVVYVGGSYSQSQSLGMFYVNYTSLTNAGANLGSRLLEFP